MEFKKEPFKLILFISLVVISLLGLMIWNVFHKTAPSVSENIETSSVSSIAPIQDIPVRPVIQDQPSEEDAAIQEQLHRDHEEQKKTKYLKIELEQTNLELEQEKALAEIDKLRMKNRGGFQESALEGQKNIPEVIVEYIGGDSVKKEAILSIAGSSYQVKKNSSPTDSIQVVSISDSSVTLHFSAPQELTKTIDYKPE